MEKKGWHTVTLLDSLLEEVQGILEKDVLGYTTKSEFIKEAILQRIIDLNKAKFLRD